MPEVSSALSRPSITAWDGVDSAPGVFVDEGDRRGLTDPISRLDREE
jgi:hypothetical protein